ncbi:zinc ribbon domain-containing protein [Natrinema gelatinilyticum]|uniref:zinc ribbon domain-containing protein n=1 Tax=Natrinema gelatinilyticum TaxID=2961571 RepID=UPI0020C5917E|nr:zinc ribbon domain-containing protein [Natrinema gelatinilyticum]
MSSPGISGVGGYAPKTRIPAEEFSESWGQFEGSGIESTAVLDADEDSITMAYEAARRALDVADTDGPEIKSLAFATTMPPMAEAEISVHLSELFDLPDDASLRFYTGSTRVGLQALVETLTDARPTPALIVAADCPKGAPDDSLGQAAGAGAAAFVITEDGPVQVRDHATYAESYQGTRFRPTGRERTEQLDITEFDREAFTTTIAAAIEQLTVKTERVDVAAIQAPDGALPYRAGKVAGIDPSAIEDVALVHDIGDTGAASVPLSLARALSTGNDTVLTAAFGSGAVSEAAVFGQSRERPVPTDLSLEGATEITYAEYLRQHGEITSGAPDGGGAYVSVPAWKRTLTQRYRLEAGRCPNCDTLNFPPRGACSNCHDLVEYDNVQLEPTGTVEAVTVISQGGAPPEFIEQQARTGDYIVAIVAIDGPDSGSASIPTQIVEAEPGTIDIGDRVAFTIRRIYVQEGVIRYGMKFRPEQD